MKTFAPLFIYSLCVLNCSPLSAPSPSLYSAQVLNEEYNLSDKITVGLQDSTLNRLFNSTACIDFKSHVWNHIYITLFDQYPPPSPPIVQKKIKTYAQNYLLKKGASPRVVRDFSRHFVNIYSAAFNFFSDKPEELILEELAQIDLLSDSPQKQEDSQINKKIIQFLDKVQKDFNSLKKLTAFTDLECRNIYPDHVIVRKNIDIPFLSSMKKNLHPLVYGARKVMATAYQSCHVLDLPLLSLNNPDTRGIIKTSYHRGGGFKRAISSLSSLNKSHYYLRNAKTPANQCINISKNPLIYDFGGKPSVSSYPYSQINLFKNAGSGSKSLGVDCSGFVLSSLAVAGLRVKNNKPIKAAHISGISSWMLANPSNGLNCLKKVHTSTSKIIKAGDIIASKGHVVIVDQVGKDPLGISYFRSVKNCKNISPQQFHFSIIHSSPIFNGIGINRVHIKHADQPLLLDGLVQLASRLCYKKFGHKVPLKIKGITISRHTLSNQCTEDEMYLKGEECLSSCWNDLSI